MAFEKVAKVQRRCRIWYPFTPQVDATEVAKRCNVIQRILTGFVSKD
jgi:hypothetical protein